MTPIDEIIYKYSNHPSITKINNITKLTERFSFDKVDQMQIEKEILQLNAKKSARPVAIPPKTIKDVYMVLSPPLTQLFNTSVDENHFPSELKKANV